MILPDLNVHIHICMCVSHVLLIVMVQTHWEEPQLSRSVKSNVIILKEEGYCNKQIAERFSISQASASHILKKSSKNLTLSPKKWSGRPSENHTVY